MTNCSCKSVRSFAADFTWLEFPIHAVVDEPHLLVDLFEV